MSQIIDEIARWREGKWWLSDEYVQGYRDKIAPAQVDACVNAVLQVFNEPWLSTVEHHNAFYELFSRGWNPLEALVSIGQDLLSVKGAPGFKDVVESLRKPGEYESAKLELSLAALCRESGFVVSLRPASENGRSADLLTLIASEEVFVEVKSIQRSDDSIALDVFTTRLVTSLDELNGTLGFPPAEFKYRLELDRGIAKTWAKQVAEDPMFLHKLYANTMETIAKGLKAWKLAFTIPTIGNFRLAHKDAISDSAVLTPIENEVELSRLLRSRLNSAIRQLPSNRPGIIVLRTHGVLEERRSNVVAREILRAKGDMASHLSAIIFLPIVYSLFERWSPFKGFAVLNPATRCPASSLQVFQLLANKFGLEVFDH